MAIEFPTAPTNGQTYDFGGVTYTYESLNNRWISSGMGAGGGAITVSQTRPDPAAGSPGDLWWYCGADGEDPGLFTLVEDTATAEADRQQHWIQSSPGIAFEGSSGGGGGADLPLFSFSEGAVSVGVAVTNTYTVPYTGTYRIILVGAGGTGYVSDTGGSFGAGIGAGGGAGFAMIHAMALEAGDTVAYSLAARLENRGQDSPGSAAGNSSVSINGTEVMTANGGGAGSLGASGGGAGGTATGGDFRLAGSDGSVGNFGAAGGLGGLANITTTGATSIPTYLGNLIGGFTGNGGVSTSNGTSTGHAAYFGIQGSGMTN